MSTEDFADLVTQLRMTEEYARQGQVLAVQLHLHKAVEIVERLIGGGAEE